MVITTWSGASASDIEQEVTEEVEDRLATIQGVDELTSISAEGRPWLSSVLADEFRR